MEEFLLFFGLISSTREPEDFLLFTWKMNLSVFLFPLLCFVDFCGGQSILHDERGFLLNRRPIPGGGGGSPCNSEVYDSVDPDQRSLLALAGGAVVGGVVGGAAGYHLGMKQQKPIIINNNVVNQLPSPCYSIPVHVTTGGGNGGGWGGGSGGIIGGILSNHPILSNILQGGLLGGGGNRVTNRVTNRNIRQFNRQIIRPISRIFK